MAVSRKPTAILGFSVLLAFAGCGDTPQIAASKERCYRQVDRYLSPKNIRESDVNQLYGIKSINPLTKEVAIREACEDIAGTDFTVGEAGDLVLSKIYEQIRKNQ